MKSINKIFKYPVLSVLLIVFFLALIKNVDAQQTAPDWFNRGVASNNINEKITCYNKAIELDSSFVEAYYNLGLAYKKQNRLAEAESVLRKAYTSFPYSMDNDLKIKVVYELGMTNKRLGRYAEAKEALLGVTNLTTDAKVRSQIIYEVGRVCILLEEYDEAIRQFNRGLELAPQNSSYFEDAIRTAQRLGDAKAKYAEANLSLEQGNYQDAATGFQEVLRIDPNYKDARSKLLQAQNDLSQSRRKGELESLYQQGMAQLRMQDWTAAQQSFQKLFSLDPNYKDTRSRLDEAQLGLDTSMREESIERHFQEGVAAHRAQNWTKAIIAFDRVRELDPNYKDVNARIREVQRAMDRQGLESTKSRYYNQGIMALQNGDYRAAISAFQTLITLAPDYRDVKERLVEAQQAQEQSDTKSDVANFYADGVEALAKGEWLDAVIAFEKAKSINPDYQDIQEKLAQAKQLLAQGSQGSAAVIAGKKSPWTIVALIAIFLFVPIAGVIAFSPTLRARIYQLQGNYNRAIAVYERLLERNPGLVKLYLLLAEAYLQQNRKDDKAVRAFEMVLRLNLNSPQKKQILNIVANHYLREGRTDDEALQLMEKALGSELDKGAG